MTPEPRTKMSVVEEILEEVFRSIEGRDEFGPEVMAELRELARTGGLTRANEVIGAIRKAPGETA